MTHSIIGLFIVLMVIWSISPLVQPSPNKKRTTDIIPTVPDRTSPISEKEFIARMKQIKTLVDAGKHDKAIALIRRLDIPKECEEEQEVVRST